MDPLGYEVTKAEIDEYSKEILKVDNDKDSKRWGTAKEILAEVQKL